MIGGQRNWKVRLSRAFPYKCCIVPETYGKKTLAARMVLITEASTSNQKRSEKKKTGLKRQHLSSPLLRYWPFPPPRHPTWSSQTHREASILNLSHLFITQFSSHLFSELFAIWLFIGHRHFALPGPVRFLFSLPFSAAAHRTTYLPHGTSHPPYSSTS